MTDEAGLPEEVARALDTHEAFEPRESTDPRARDAYTLTTTRFETSITATDAPGDREARFLVTVAVPTLDAAVADERVADVVEDGWFETLERRLADVFTVARTNDHEPPRLERTDREVVVHLAYRARDAAIGVDDAKTLIEYVEGTYAQGLIPGYAYRGVANELLERAMGRGQRADDGTGGDR